MLKAGDLRYHRITIQNKVLGKDSNGEDIVTWEDACDVRTPAKDVPLSVNQLISANATQSKVKGRFVIRKMNGLDDSQRVISNGKVYDIEGWFPDPESGQDYVTAPYFQGVTEGGF